MWISVILSMLRSIRRNHRAVETPVHGAFDERPFLSARDGPHPSPTAFQNGRFFPQCPGIVTATHVGDRIRSIDVCFFFLMAPQDLTEDGLQRGLCDFYCIWDLYQQYLVNEQQMLNRRTALLVNYENANRNWDKAKAHKKDEVKSPSSFFWTPFTPLAAHLFLASSVVSLIVQSPPLGHRLNGISLERSSSNATV